MPFPTSEAQLSDERSTILQPTTMNQNQSSLCRYFIAVAIIALTTLSVATPVLAQRGSPEAMKERMTQRVDGAISALALEGVKADTVKAILQSGVEKQMALMGSMQGGGDRGAMREKMSVIDADVAKQLEAVLTSEQMETYKTYMESQRMRRGGDGRGGNGQGGQGGNGQ